ncbi:FUSC family protein [Oerskovia sp. Sa1BUA8]|uniref:FUSC family protein n=1 Tax=Oerskovia douganii TaxID=2762210 RepID=A0A9D5U9K5_9CELL|nr:FUSC family protein [Oerskovia douganii]MBE7700319.1 FUSC family protein [Oerskovia douganii]
MPLSSPLTTAAPGHTPTDQRPPDHRSPVRTAAREVLDPAHLRAALRLTSVDATLAAALLCGASVAIALVIAATSGHQDLAGFAALGALTSLYGRFDPYRRRAALLTLVGVAMVGSILLTSAVTAAGAPTWVALGVVALLAGGMTALCQLLRTGPPGATIVVFAAGAGLAGAPTFADLAPRGLAGLLGVAVAWVVCLAGFLFRPSGPARLAVRRATLAAEAAALAPDDRGAVGRAHDAVALARRVLADDASHRRTRATALRLADDLSGAAGTPADLPPRLTLRATARESLTGSAGWRLRSLRVTLAAAVAAAVAHVAGFGHPAWAAMGATATLQGTTTQHAVVRALQRALGTVVGALVAWPLLDAHLGFWATAALVVALQVVTEIVVGRHYGLAMLTITPMALLMTSLGGSGEGIALDRALDTAVGAVVGVLAVVLVHARRGASRVSGTART